MNDSFTISTSSWSITFPGDWKEPADHSGETLYFVSGDETKGVYISTWAFDGDSRSADELLAGFQKVDFSTLQDMKENNWRMLKTEKQVVGNVHIWVTEYYDEANSYRVVGKLVACLPMVTRAAFHDYFCQSVAESDRYLSPIIKSLAAIEAQPGVQADRP